MIGLGFGAAVHVPGWRLVPGAEVVAIAGSSPERTHAAAARLGAKSASIEAILDGDLDAVSIAVPPAAAEPIATRALTRGLAVLTEKPLAADLAAAERLAVLARGRTAAVDFQLPDLSTFSAFKAFADSGAFGTLQRAHLVWLSWSYALANGLDSWKLSAFDGGALNLFGSHALHMAEWLFGPLRTLSARLDDSRTRRTAAAGASVADDTAELAGDFESGARFTALISNAAPGGTVHRWVAVFEGGTATLESTKSGHLDGFTFVVRDALGQVVATQHEPEAKGDARIVPFSRVAARFAVAARAGAPATPDFAAGLRVQSLIAAARHSHVNGGVALPVGGGA